MANDEDERKYYSDVEATEIVNNIIKLAKDTRGEESISTELVKLFEYPNHYENLDKLEEVYKIIIDLKDIPEYYFLIKYLESTKALIMLASISALVQFEKFNKLFETKSNKNMNLATKKKRYDQEIKKLENKFKEIKPFLNKEASLSLPSHPNDIYKGYQFLLRSSYQVSDQDVKEILNLLLNPEAKELPNADGTYGKRGLTITKNARKDFWKLRNLYESRPKEEIPENQMRLIRIINEVANLRKT